MAATRASTPRTTMAAIASIQPNGGAVGYSGAPHGAARPDPSLADHGRSSELGHGGERVAGRHRPRRVAPGQGSRHRGSQAQRLLLFDVVGPLVEFRHDLACEELERRTDVLVSVATRLAHEDELIDTGVLVLPHESPDL